MALSQSDLLRLLESLRSADGLELVRGVAERMLQELIEAEATARIGAQWNEHTEARTTFRNGHRDKTLTTAGRRPGPGHPQAAVGQLLPRAAGAAPPHRPGPVRGHHGGLRPRRVHALGRRMPTTVSSWVRTASAVGWAEIVRIVVATSSPPPC